MLPAGGVEVLMVLDRYLKIRGIVTPVGLIATDNLVDLVDHSGHLNS
jgi:hypothetical protein